MRKTEKAVMWTGAVAALLFGVTQTAAAIIRGEWFTAFCFAAMVGLSKGWVEALIAEERKEAGNEGDKA